MATLIVDLHCMCLFVPDPTTGSMHVLMPAMTGLSGSHDHGGGHPPAEENALVPELAAEKAEPNEGEEEETNALTAEATSEAAESSADAHGHNDHSSPDTGGTPGSGSKDANEEGDESGDTGGGGNGAGAAKIPEKHVVRMLHRSFTGQRKGRSMEGWALVLDDGRGPARLQLTPFVPSLAEGEVPDITTLSGRPVNPGLISGLRPDGVVSRVTFRAGEVSEVRSNGYRWTFGLQGPQNKKQVRVLSHSLTWVIHNVPDQLTWIRLNATQPPPILSLRELAPEANDVYRIGIHHESERTLPPGNGVGLKPAEVRHHFAAFYTLLGMTPPDGTNPAEQHLLPFLDGRGWGSVMCRNAMARLTV